MEDRLVEITDVEWNEEKRIKRIEDSLKELWDNFKHTNIHIIGVPEGEERDKGPEKISEETIAENFPNMGMESFTQIQEAQQIPYRINPRRNTPRHILIKLTNIKGKEQILKASREKQQITYKGSPVRLSADFSTETLQARREWHDIFKVTKGKKPATKNTLPSKTFFQI
uniref:L1 transposable element RRM domain-containing protein n=2 Tax=Sus scrofa TaxID=9823 RepID=A0A8D1YKF4_PIG